jgi:hypothetical protein
MDSLSDEDALVSLSNLSQEPELVHIAMGQSPRDNSIFFQLLGEVSFHPCKSKGMGLS